ncbi:hypothetical protein ACP4OV_017073 [Aristida adscensionis]
MSRPARRSSLLPRRQRRRHQRSLWCKSTLGRLLLLLQPPPPEQRSAAPLLDGVTGNEGDSLLHVVAASGDGDEFLRCARMIYHGNKGLLVARNKNGDTPLHCAAGAGNDKMISCLLDLAITEAAAGDEAAVKRFVRARNEHGETALHRAVRAGSKGAMDVLMSVDDALACVPRDGEQGASPFYLAISLGELDVARHLFLDATKGKLSYSGSDGGNVLHAAVSRGRALPMLLEWFKDVTVEKSTLVSELASQRDKDGSTPLHLASSLEGWPDEKFPSKWFQQVWQRSKSTTTLLLDANPCAAYQPDKQGLYPIHVAALVGSLQDVKTLLKRCPDCATLRDGKGRTFLHIAVEESYKVVRHICLMPNLSSVLNMLDNNGDTALHRAVHVGNLSVFSC